MGAEQARNHRRPADLTRVWPAGAYTGVDAWALQEILDAEPERSVTAVDPQGLRLVRPYVPGRTDESGSS